jgi:sugar transferase (PEP-CTERM system associated)
MSGAAYIILFFVNQYLFEIIADNSRLSQIIFIIITFIFFLYIYGLYDVKENSSAKHIFIKLLLTSVSVTFFCSPFFYFFKPWESGRKFFLIHLIISSFLVFGWRLIYKICLPRVIAKEKAIIIGAGRTGIAICNRLEEPASPYEVVGFVDDDPDKQVISNPATILGTTDNLSAIAEETQANCAIFAISGNRSSRLMHNVLQARIKGIKILEMARVYEKLFARVPVEHIQDQWLVFAEGFNNIANYYKKIKRFTDIACSIFAFLVFAPILLLVALLIRLDSPGPIFYQQQRVGEDGSIFTIFKFRSMHVNAEENGPVWAQKNDPRVTRVGRWLRIFRIDEIPQFWNVLRGEMSLIGPRPERPDFVNKLEEIIPYYFIRHTVKPGLSGWAQLNYPYGSSIQDALVKLEYDLYYIKNLSFWLDSKIALRTIGVVLLRQGSR